MTRPARSDILARLRGKIAAGLPIIGGGAGTGLSANSEEARGIDLIVLCHGGPIAMPEDAAHVLARAPLPRLLRRKCHGAAPLRGRHRATGGRLWFPGSDAGKA